MDTLSSNAPIKASIKDNFLTDCKTRCYPFTSFLLDFHITDRASITLMFLTNKPYSFCDSAVNFDCNIESIFNAAGCSSPDHHKGTLIPVPSIALLPLFRSFSPGPRTLGGVY